MISENERSRANKQETERIKSLLRSRLDSLVSELFGNVAKKNSKEFRLGAITGEKGDSLVISRVSGKEGLWIDHNTSGAGSGDVLGLIMKNKNMSFPEAMNWSREWLGEPKWEFSQTASGKNAREADREYLERRKKILRGHEQALKWLYDRGLTDETIDYFNLGLSTPYKNKDGVVQQDALIAPILNAEGVFIKKTAYYNIPGVTVAPTNKNGWMAGAVQTYHSGKHKEQKSVFVCEGLKDLWRVQQALKDKLKDLDLLIISSTHGSGIPEEWKTREFWERFDNVFLGHDNDAAGNKMAGNLAGLIPHEAMRVFPPEKYGKDWTDFWQNGGSIEEFTDLLSEAEVISPVIIETKENSNSEGRFAYDPVDIGTAYHKGNLYYAVKTVTKGSETVTVAPGVTKSLLTQRIETVLIRSDRTTQSVVEERAPAGTSSEDRVLSLTDGLLIREIPRASDHTSWSWKSIKEYLESQGKTRPLIEILLEIKTFLKQTVWLPYDHDYNLLTLLVPVTYAQAIFQSVPLVMVVGPPGSGKSALGQAMCGVSANAVSIGQASAAAVARLIHETKGFVTLDDLESIAKGSRNKDGQFSDLVQHLKLSYNKDTSRKVVIDVNRKMTTTTLNFFGVKMINNTSGSDNILGSRMLRIQTRKIPGDLVSHLSDQGIWDSRKLNDLRDELHRWTFENVALIDSTYKALSPRPLDRNQEISAPLRVFAELAGDDDLSLGLEKALQSKHDAPSDLDDPTDVLLEVMKQLVVAGYRDIAPTHVALEMNLSIDRNSNRTMTNEVSVWEDPTWIGRQLRNYDIIDTNSPPRRHRLHGKSLRIYPINQHFIDEALTAAQNDSADADAQDNSANADAQDNSANADAQDNSANAVVKSAEDFCKVCASCSYRSLNCPIMQTRYELGPKYKK